MAVPIVNKARADHPILLYIWVTEGGSFIVFKNKEEAIKYLEDSTSTHRDATGILGTYSLVGLKKIKKSTSITEEDYGN